MKLYLKLSRIGLAHTRRMFAWTSLRSRGLGPFGVLMSEAEASEFEYAVEHGKHSVIGAGGQYEYRVYDRADVAEQFPYIVVYPDSPAVREQYPESCRVVNLKTGAESSLCHNLQAALDTIAEALAGRLRGSFN